MRLELTINNKKQNIKLNIFHIKCYIISAVIIVFPHITPQSLQFAQYLFLYISLRKENY